MHKLPDLPYSYDALEPYIDAKTVEIHHDKHHATYVANLNKALESLPAALQGLDLVSLAQHLADVPDASRTAVKNNLGGVYNHNLYWSVLAPKKGGKPAGALLAAIERDFGGFDKFQEKFESAALTRFGSGWAWLSVTDGGKLAVSSTPNQDNPYMDGSGKPILLIDVWEHAYYLRYQNRRAEYIKNFWNVINWDEVSRLYAGFVK